MRIKKGDTVQVIAGKDRGRSGTVIGADPGRGRVTIEGVNEYKKRVRPKQQGQKGETVLLSRPLDISNVQLVCSHCKKPARVGYRIEGAKKVRYCKKCDTAI